MAEVFYSSDSCKSDASKVADSSELLNTLKSADVLSLSDSQMFKSTKFYCTPGVSYLIEMHHAGDCASISDITDTRQFYLTAECHDLTAQILALLSQVSNVSNISMSENYSLACAFSVPHSHHTSKSSNLVGITTHCYSCTADASCEDDSPSSVNISKTV